MVDSRDGEGPLLACAAAIAAQTAAGLTCLRIDVRPRGTLIAAKDLFLAARHPAATITCWSPGALRPALLPGPLAAPAGRTLRAHLEHVPDFTPGQLRRLKARGTIVAPAPIAAHFESLGVSAIAAPLVVPPCPRNPERRAALRSALSIDPSARVMLLLADPPSSGEARRFIHEVGTLTVGGIPMTGLMPRAFGMARAARLFESLQRFIPIVVFDGPLSAAAQAADIAVWRPAKLTSPGAYLAAHLAGTFASPGLTIVAPSTPLSVALSHAFPLRLASDCHAIADGPHTNEHHAMCREISRIIDPSYLQPFVPAPIPVPS